jgi:hypothetical protein
MGREGRPAAVIKRAFRVLPRVHAETLHTNGVSGALLRMTN